MARGLAFTPFLTGDPLVLEANTSLPVLARAVGPASVDGAGIRPLAPGVAPLHTLRGLGDGVAVRVVRLPHAPLLDGAGAVEIVIVLTFSIRESAVALRLASRLKAGFRDAALARRVAAARTREDLVRALAVLDDGTGEAPLSGEEPVAFLASGENALSRAEAAWRIERCGENRLERVGRRSLVAEILEQFVGFFAILLWVGGGLAFLAGMPELGWAIFAVIVVNGLFGFSLEYRAERAVEELQELLPHEIEVVRGGEGWRLGEEGRELRHVRGDDAGDELPDVGVDRAPLADRPTSFSGFRCRSR